MTSRKFEVVEDEKFITKKGLCVPLGSKIQMEAVLFSMGGCGANTAVTFSRQGLRTAYLGQIGRDIGGQTVKQTLSGEGVSLDLLKETDKWNTSLSVILSLPDVDRSILQYLGASHYLTKDDLPFEKMKAKWFYLGPLSGQTAGIFEPLVNFGHQNKIKMALTPGKNQLEDRGLELLRSLLNKMDIVIMNQEEASQLTGIDYKKEKEIFKLLDEWVDGVVVMTKGSEGVTASDGQYLYSAGIPESGLVDRTGAGDAFSSAFISGWIEKGDIAYAIQLGTANATACLQELGATNGLLKKGEWGQWEKVGVKKEKI